MRGLYATYQELQNQAVQQEQEQEKRAKQKKADHVMSQTLRCIGGIIRFAFSAIIYVLAAIGLICLVAAQFYPETKEGLLCIWYGLIEQIEIVMNF